MVKKKKKQDSTWVETRDAMVELLNKAKTDDDFQRILKMIHLSLEICL